MTRAQWRRRVRTAISLVRQRDFRAVARRLVDAFGPRRSISEVDLVFELLRRDGHGVMLDVGAHHGQSLAAFADAGWQVHAFEPDRRNRAPLEARYGTRTNVVIDPRGVADAPARGVPFFRSDLSTGISGLSAFHASHVPDGTIDVTTVAQVCAERRIAAIDLLKIDTEGYDLFVLRGVPWEQLAPRVIICEFEDTKTVPLGYTFHELAGYLQQRGYHVLVSEWYPITAYGASHAWRRFAPYPSELVDPRGWGNLIATRSAATYDDLRALCRRWA